MLELQNNWWYCKVYLHYVENVDKVKMDYSLYPLVDDGKVDHTLKSANSEERFDLNEFKQCKIGLVKKVKLKDGIHFSFIFKNQISDFSEMEKSTLPRLKDYISRQLAFNPRFKKFFLERISFLSECE